MTNIREVLRSALNESEVDALVTNNHVDQLLDDLVPSLQEAFDGRTIQQIGIEAIQAAEQIGDKEGIETGCLTWWYGEALSRGAEVQRLKARLAQIGELANDVR